MMPTPLWAQLINLLAAVLLLLSFAMLAQRRVLTLIDLFAAQGLALACSTGIVAFATGQPAFSTCNTSHGPNKYPTLPPPATSALEYCPASYHRTAMSNRKIVAAASRTPAASARHFS